MEELRRGPWTVEEDLLLVQVVAEHGEGRWNTLARCAGLKRTGKSCRLRWLNYLRPDVRHGNITAEEELLILELHCRLGNRWSKIAQHLPGRTDNEIKNYWRTRVQKHAKRLHCEVNSKKFRDMALSVWMPRLLERVQANRNRIEQTTLNLSRSMVSIGSTSIISSSEEHSNFTSPNSTVVQVQEDQQQDNKEMTHNDFPIDYEGEIWDIDDLSNEYNTWGIIDDE